jgi:hypothetical protein
MTQLTVFQRGADDIFTRMESHAILDTITWTIDSNGEITNEASSKSAILGVMQDLTAEDFTRITAGNMPKADKKFFTRRTTTLRAGKYADGSSVKQMFIIYPGDGTTTSPSAAKKYEITQVGSVPQPSQNTPNNSTNQNKVYTKVFLKELPI